VSRARFDQQVLEILDRQREILIETVRPDGSRRRTTIWVVVDDGDVFVRSWRGAGARWFRAALDRPGDVTLALDQQTLAVRAVPAADDESIARCSSALERKYAGDPSRRSMVREEILGTTLRLQPR
jgi:hypothetical protein